jgi:hypothetical protein
MRVFAERRADQLTMKKYCREAASAAQELTGQQQLCPVIFQR